jgi:hypothetical protein
MSGIDPPAALAAARVAAAEASMIEAALNLGVSAEQLRSQIRAGDVLPAKILAPVGGQDLIEIAGRPVVAQLPPGLNPGQTILLQVTGFAGTQMFVRNLGAPDAANPMPLNDVVLTAASAEPEMPAHAESAPQPAAQQQAAPISPPRAVFVAASVRQAPVVPAQAQHAAQPIPAQTATAQTAFRGVEARIAAAQTAKVTPPHERATAAVPPPPQAAPFIASRSAMPAAAAVQQAVARAVQTVSELLRAVRLPDTPFTRMAATIAAQAPERLSAVLTRLEAALPQDARDARIATLRTLIGFTAKLDPSNPETLRAQISAFVSNVVEGVESKIAQLLQAHTDKAPAPLVQARVAERSAAISHDLKSLVLSLLREPPEERTPAMTQALTETLITLTGVQVNTLSSSQQSPGTIAFALPVYYHEGGRPAHIRISPDARSRAGKMDGDNFHVSFVLDTAHLGTVAIDLQTTGRSVKLDVKTEHERAAARFSETLSSLRSRLEDLRYRVASAGAKAVREEPRESRRTVRAGKANDAGLDLQA